MKTNGNLLQVAQLGHPILRKKAKIVTDIAEPKIQMLIDDLLATVMEVNGVGIAAPQVYQSYRIFIVASHPNPRRVVLLVAAARSAAWPRLRPSIFPRGPATRAWHLPPIPTATRVGRAWAVRRRVATNDSRAAAA